MAATSFKIRNIAPPDLRNYGRDIQLMFWEWVVDFGLKAKDRDLSQGLAADGQPLAMIRPKTRKYRRSAMTPSGKGDPGAPYLMPARALSRTRSLLAGRALPTHADFYWRFDAFTGDSWGKVLAIHARRGPRHDVIGLSPDATRRVRAQAWQQWDRWKRGQPVVQRAAMGPAMTPPVIRPTGGKTWPEWRKYLTQPAVVTIPGRPVRTYNRLLQHVWGMPGKPPGAAAPIARPRPTLPKVEEPPKPKKKGAFTAHEFGPSRAAATFLGDSAASAKAIFGHDMTAQQIASIAGAPDGATVRILFSSHDQIEIRIEHPQIEVMTRTIRKDRGKVIIHNDIFKLKPEYQGSQVGLTAFAREVEQASKAGVSHIETLAFRIKGDTYVDPRSGETREKWAGYYVWPSFGYDGPLQAHTKKILRESSLSEKLKSARHVRDLFADPAGKAWWKEHGTAIDVEFDLKPDSYSMQTLDAYLHKKLPAVVK